METNLQNNNITAHLTVALRVADADETSFPAECVPMDDILAWRINTCGLTQWVKTWESGYTREPNGAMMDIEEIEEIRDWRE